MSLEVFVLGTGGMIPLPNRHLTSVLLRRDGDLFLFDCGEGTQVALRKLNLKWKKITAIFISHTHADHITGLPGLLMLSSQVDRDEPLYIIGPPKTKDYIESSRRDLDMYINYEIKVIEIAPKKRAEVFKKDGFSVYNFPLDHTKPCVGYSLVENDRAGIFNVEAALSLKVPKGPKWSMLQNGNSVEADDGKIIEPSMVLGPPRRGLKFSFVTDTAYLESISENVKDSDLLICEGMFKKDLEKDAKDKKHLTSIQAGKIALDAGGVKKMGLIHYSPRYTYKEIRELREETREVFKDTFLCEDGMSITLNNLD